MSKGLEAITSPISSELRNGKQYYTYAKEDVETIEKELKALEKIKELYKSYVEKIGLNEKDILGFDLSFAYIEKTLKTLEIVKKFVWIEDGEIHLGLYADSEIILSKDDFETQEEYDLLKEVGL